MDSTSKHPQLTIDFFHIRIRDNEERGSLSTTSIPLPPLQLPTEGIIAVLSIPPAATLHVPISLTLTVRNYHPLRSANIVVQLELDTSDSFVVAGLRSGRIPILLPGAEEQLTWRLIPIECGYVKVPRIQITNRRLAVTSGIESSTESGTKGEMVKIIDVRLDQRPSDDSKDIPRSGLFAEKNHSGLGTVLVLP